MLTILVAAAIAAQPAGSEVGFADMVAGRNDAAITVIERQAAKSADPAQLINLGVAYARLGDLTRARAMFRAAYAAPEPVDLETASGEWVYSRTLARQALAMLDSGRFAGGGVLARK